MTNATEPRINQRITFSYNGRTVTGYVRSTVHYGVVLTAVIVFSPDLGHTHRIDHGHTVMPHEIIQ